MIAPKTQLDHFLQMKSDYTAAKQTRFTRSRSGVPSMGAHADYHFRSESDYLRLMEVARDIDRNDVVVGQAVNRFCDNVFQSGFIFAPNTGDDNLDKELKSRWTEWSENPRMCDAAAERTFAELSYDAFRASIVDGDIFGLPLKSGQLEMIEGHRCRSSSHNKRKTVVHGIEMNGHRRRKQYWFTKEDVSPHATIKWDSLTSRPAFDSAGNKTVFQWYLPRRVSQSRGVTAFAPIVDTVTHHDDITFATLVKAQANACYAFIREKPQGVSIGSGKKLGTSEGVEADDAVNGWDRLVENYAPGMHVRGEPGEMIKGFSPNIPNAEYFQHMHLILSYIAINLNLPVIVLLMDARETNFSGWRGAIDQAKITWKRMQDKFCRHWNCEVVRWKIRQWMRDDPILDRQQTREGINLFGHLWQAPGWDYIEPNKDALADVVQLANGIASHEMIQSRRGRNEAVVRKQIVDNNFERILYALERAGEINGQYPDADVHWRELMPMPLAERTQMNFSEEKRDEDAPAKKEIIV